MGFIILDRDHLGDERMHDPDFLAVWVWINLESGFGPRTAQFGGQQITLERGQFVTGRKQLSKLSGVNEFKIERILNHLETRKLIRQKASTSNRLITILPKPEITDTQTALDLIEPPKTGSDEFTSPIKIGKVILDPSFLNMILRKVQTPYNTLLILYRAHKAKNIRAYVIAGMKSATIYKPTQEETDNPKAVRDWIETHLYGDKL
jgi:hypothetical protein